MKKSLLFTFIFVLNYSVRSQTTIEEVSGNYIKKYELSNALLIDKLTLNADGTFNFHSYEKIEERLIQEGNKYVKGTWRVEKNLIYFTTTKSDFDDKYTLDFTNTKARFITKSPRDKFDRDIKTSLRFYESEVSWVTGRELFKVE